MDDGDVPIMAQYAGGWLLASADLVFYSACLGGKRLHVGKLAASWTRLYYGSKSCTNIRNMS
jgi:hypothetical protein